MLHDRDIRGLSETKLGGNRGREGAWLHIVTLGPSAAATVLLGAKPSRVRRLGGSGNEHWIVTTAAGRHVLRRFAVSHDQDSIAWEQEVIEHLASRGWPVPAVVAGPAELAGRTWMAMRRLPGRPMAATAATSFERGKLLALLHRDLSSLKVEQRPGWDRKHLAAAGLAALLDDLPEVLAERIPDRAERLSERMVEFTDKTLARLDSVNLDGMPESAIHGDLMPWNILVERGSVSGILDFEKAHVDLLAIDLAFATWGGRYEKDVVGGYESEAGTISWSSELLQLLWATTCLFALQRHLTLRRSGIVAGGLGWSIEHALRPWGS